MGSTRAGRRITIILINSSGQKLTILIFLLVSAFALTWAHQTGDFPNRWSWSTTAGPAQAQISRSLIQPFAFASFQQQSNTLIYLPVIVSGSRTFYVSKLGNNSAGTSWATAWNELDQINWAVIRPGDRILLDGGASQMIYKSTLTLSKSGTPGHPITIQVANVAGRNGKVVIFGGRSKPLPYCGQIQYEFETKNVRNVGVLINAAWLIIDGQKWQGLSIYGHNAWGIRLNPGAGNITLRNLEIYDNGFATQELDGWYPNSPGLRIAGPNITLERVLIHDNGQDAIQSGNGNNGLANFTIRQSWLANLRQHPTVAESFNWCTHTDGIQIFDGGSLSGFLIENTIIGPGFTNGVNMGQQLEPSGVNAVTNNVTFRDVLFMKPADNGIMGHPTTKPKGWLLDHVTAHCPNTKWNCLFLEGSEHRVSNSIIFGARLYLPDGLDQTSGNCQWQSEGFQLGQIVEFKFVDVDHSDPFSLDDYTLLPHSPCTGAGSRLTSVAQLLNSPDPQAP